MVNLRQLVAHFIRKEDNPSQQRVLTRTAANFTIFSSWLSFVMLWQRNEIWTGATTYCLSSCLRLLASVALFTPALLFVVDEYDGSCRFYPGEVIELKAIAKNKQLRLVSDLQVRMGFPFLLYIDSLIQ